jgi:hypothetical protein
VQALIQAIHRKRGFDVAPLMHEDTAGEGGRQADGHTQAITAATIDREVCE